MATGGFFQGSFSSGFNQPTVEATLATTEAVDALSSPTREMIREAASAGYADVVHGDIPKLQIVAIEEWFKGKMPLLPPLEHLPSAAFSRRSRPAQTTTEIDTSQPELPFSFIGGKAQIENRTKKSAASHATDSDPPLYLFTRSLVTGTIEQNLSNGKVGPSWSYLQPGLASRAGASCYVDLRMLRRSAK